VRGDIETVEARQGGTASFAGKYLIKCPAFPGYVRGGKDVGRRIYFNVSADLMVNDWIMIYHKSAFEYR
jgi:hypothetical protein